MITRVTQQSTQRNVLANMQRNLAAMSNLQEQASSGKKISKASDDPSRASDAMSLRSERAATQQYARNAQDGLSWLNTIDSTLVETSSSLRRARDLVVQGSNLGAASLQSREALASELEGIKAALMEQANTQYMGRSVFAGTSDAGNAFDPATYAFTGSAGGSVERRTAADVTVRVDGDGAAIFGSSTNPADANNANYSVFQLLDDVATTLRSGGDPSTALGQLDTRLNAVITNATSVGARTNQIESSMTMATDKAETLRNDISGVEDIDLAQTIMDLKLQEVGYQSSLNSAARVLQPTLLDFLR